MLGKVSFYFHFTAVQFQVCIQNRYKLNKKYRKLLPTTAEEANRMGANSFMAQAKVR